MIAGLWLDLRFALRGIRLRPAFNALVVLSLGLGIAANVAIFSLVNAMLLKPLAVYAPEQLAVLLSAVREIPRPGRRAERRGAGQPHAESADPKARGPAKRRGAG
jgi:hypothetical protein